MTKFIRDNSKKLLAIFGVVLMIAFVLPVGMKSGMGSQRQLVGYVGDGKKVYNTDISHAKTQWDILEHFIVLSPQLTQGRIVTLVEAITQSRSNEMRTLAAQVQTHPETFFLLQTEAQKMGVRVTPQQVDQFLRGQNLNIRLQNGAVVDLDHVTDLQFREQIIDAVAGLLRVEAAMERVSDVVKVSEPLTRNELAAQMQRMKVRFVQLSARDFLAKVPAPTREQLQEQYEKFSKYEQDSPATTDNIHGFGYKYPNRVTLQYIAVPREEVRKVILAGKSDYDWEVDAHKYYLRHQADFQATPATTQNFGLGATSKPAAPTTRPFAEVKGEIIEKLTAPEIERKARDAQDRILARLTVDWNTWHAAHPTTAPASTNSAATSPGATDSAAGAPAATGAGASPAPSTGPATAAADYSSYEYLKRVAADVQRQTGVMPTTGQIAQLSTMRDLMKEPGIGDSTLSSGIPFANYAAAVGAPTLPQSERNTVGVLQLFQPSPVLRDSKNSTYLFRLTSARAAEKPQSIDEVAKRVEEDWRLARAYEMAKQQAEALAEEARRGVGPASQPSTQPAALAAAGAASTRAGSQPTTEPGDENAALALAAAAKKAGFDSAVTGWFNQQGPPTIPNLPLEGGAAAVFRFQTTQLLNRAATQPTHPAAAVVELPVQQQLFATQLVAVEPLWDPKTLALSEVQVEQMIKRDLSQNIRSRWLTYEAVAQRTNWKDEGRSSKSPNSSGSDNAPAGNGPFDAGEPPLGG